MAVVSLLYSANLISLEDCYSRGYDYIQSVFPNSFYSTITFASACLMTAQLAITVLAGTASLGFSNVIIVIGCWIGHRYANDEAYLERFEITAQDLHSQNAQFQTQLEENGENLEASRRQVADLTAVNDNLEEKARRLTDLVQSYESQIQTQAEALEKRKDLLQENREIIGQREIQLATLENLTKSLLEKREKEDRGPLIDSSLSSSLAAKKKDFQRNFS